MKLSKLLLQAILVSVTAGTLASCEKEKDEKTEQAQKEKAQKEKYPDACPGCGMG